MPRINLKDASPEEVRARVTELRQEFVDFSEGRRSGDAASDEGLRSMIEEVNELDTFLTLSSIEQRAAEQRARALAGAAREEASGFRSLGDAVVSEDLVRFIERGPKGEVADGIKHGGHTFESTGYSIEFGDKEGKRASSWIQAAAYDSGYRAGVVPGAEEWSAGGPPTYDSTGSGNLLPVGQPIPPTPRRARLWLRDLMPSMKTTLAQVPYVQELNPTSYEGVTGGADTVAEAGIKPSSQLSFQGQVARPTVIAATLVLTKQLFEDSPAVVDYINGRLPYLVKFKEDAEFLSGSGTWPDIGGILNQTGNPGIQQQAAVNADYAQTIGMGFADVENHDGAPNAVVMNPTDAWTMFTKRAAGGSGTFDAGTPFSALPLTVWGIQTYRSRVYPQGAALAADFQLGGMVVDREQVNVQIYRERYAEQNLVLLICEERVGTMWPRPDLFVNCAL